MPPTNVANTRTLNIKRIMKNYVTAILKTTSPVGNLGPEDVYYTHAVYRGDDYATLRHKLLTDLKSCTSNRT